jgi:hypothetical protein
MMAKLAGLTTFKILENILLPENLPDDKTCRHIISYTFTRLAGLDMFTYQIPSSAKYYSDWSLKVGKTCDVNLLI